METWNAIVNLLLAAAIAVYALAGVLLLKERLRRVGLTVFALGWGVNAALVVVNWVACGEPPFGNLYHVLVFVSLCFAPAYVILAAKEGLGWLHKVFAFTSAVPLIGPVFMERNVLWRRVPALQSSWFVPHVVAYMFSYSLMTVGFVLIVIGWFRRVERERYQRASYETVRFAFPFLTFGMLSGAIWADEAWGIYWSWDPKETWAMITWTLYVVYFHCRLRPQLRRYVVPAQVAAFLALLTTFFLVNLLPKLASALHSYT